MRLFSPAILLLLCACLYEPAPLKSRSMCYVNNACSTANERCFSAGITDSLFFSECKGEINQSDPVALALCDPVWIYAQCQNASQACTRACDADNPVP
jgi:hypothetical protein